jgi:hypothetical protein
MINTNTTKLHTAKNINGNSLPPGSPASMDDLAMPTGFQQGQAPEGIQEQAGAVGQPQGSGLGAKFKRLFGIGKQNQEQVLQPEAPQEPVSAQEPVMASVPEAVAQAEESPFATPEEARQYYNDEIQVQKGLLQEELRKQQDLSKDYEKTMEEMEMAEGDFSPEGILKSAELSGKVVSLKREMKRNQIEIGVATRSIAVAEGELRKLPEPESEISRRAKALLATAEKSRQVRHTNQNSSTSSELIERLDKTRAEQIATTPAPEVVPMGFDSEQTDEQIEANRELAAWKQKRAAMAASKDLNAAVVKQPGSIH